MYRRFLVALVLVLGVVAAPRAAHADAAPPMPGPDDTAAATKAGADAGPAPASAATSASTNTAAVSYRVFATQYVPNTSGSVEVAVPDKCAKFAALGLTSALASANCPSGYQTSLNWHVIVKRDSGQQLRIPVKDVGPWNEDDNYWDPVSGSRPRRLFRDLQRGMPESQAAFYNGYNTVSNCKNLNGSLSGHPGAADQFGRCVLNPAGIDLSVPAAAQLGLGSGQNEWVTVTFQWEQLALPRQPDVLWHDPSTGKTFLWVMSRTKKVRAVALSLPKHVTFPKPNWSTVATGDFNRDGHPDILWWNRDTNALQVWFMKGASFVGRSVVNANGSWPPTQWQPVATADFNRDGRPDVLWHNTNSGHLSIWYMGGTTRRNSVEVTLPSGTGWPSSDLVPFAADGFNRDKIPDIAWHSDTTGQISIWYMSGTSGSTLATSRGLTLAPGATWPSPAAWTPVGSGDFNRDRTPDILWHKTSDGSLAVWLMSGTDGSTESSSVAVTAPSFPPPADEPIVWR